MAETEFVGLERFSVRPPNRGAEELHSAERHEFARVQRPEVDHSESLDRPYAAYSQGSQHRRKASGTE